jgi:multidrug efflux system membrane fusion protein
MRLLRIVRHAARSYGPPLLLLAALACSKKQDQKGRPSVPVSITKAKKTDVPYVIEANGVVIPTQSSAVTSQVEGIIQHVGFREGQDVVKGQVLFQIDARPYRAAYMQTVANLARDRANAENALRESQRYASLVAQDYVTREQADQQRANAAAGAATAAATEASVQTAKFNLDNTTIRAPISGRTGALLVREGNVVHASGSTPLVVINQISPLLVRFAIPATQLPLLQKYGSAGGLSVVATQSSGATTVDTTGSGAIGLSVGGDPGVPGGGGPPGSGSSSTQPGGPGSGGPGTGGAPVTSSALSAITQPEHGTLSFIDNAVDTTTGTVVLKASFANPNKRLWIGEFVATQLKLFVEQNALVVPTQAVVTGQQGAYVYVVTDSNTAQQRSVTVERNAGSLAVIAAGLRDGERVVTEGQSRLTPNAKVSLNTPQGVPLNGAGGPGGGRRGAGGAAGQGGARQGGAGRAGGGNRPAGSARPGAAASGAPANAPQ